MSLYSDEFWHGIAGRRLNEAVNVFRSPDVAINTLEVRS